MFTITIDGKAGCGKSTLADALSKKLNLKKFNTGAVYRGITCEYFKEFGMEKPNDEKIKKFVKNLNVKVVFENEEQQVIVNNSNFTPRLRDEEVSNFVALISPYDEVREKVRKIQRDFAKNYDCIMEGRDIGTVVLPNADCKLFVTASNEVRAKRRLEQLKSQPDCPTYEELLKELNDRDYKDEHREHGAMLPAEDGEIVDNSNETLEQTLARCLKIVAKKKIDKKTK